MLACRLLYYSQKNKVVILDLDKEKVDKVNNKISTISDPDIENYLSKNELNLSATLNKESAYKDSDFIIIATPTDYDPVTNQFDTSSVDSVVKDALNFNKNALIVIKSTIPVGHTADCKKKINQIELSFHLNFLERDVLFMIIYIHQESLLAVIVKRAKFLPLF